MVPDTPSDLPFLSFLEGSVLSKSSVLRTVRRTLVQTGPLPDTLGPVMSIEFERVEALELLAMTLAHLNDAEARREVSTRVPLLLTIRDKLALALREEP